LEITTSIELSGTVGMIVGLVASGHDKEKILEMYPYLEAEDIDEALKYAA
jgi:uncharacterized protein (DUF433 family)